MALVMGISPLGGYVECGQRRGTIVMAVPKKRTSKMKKRIRHAVWMQKARKAADKALSLAKSVLTGRSNSFYYETEEPPAPKCSAGDYALTEEGMAEEIELGRGPEKDIVAGRFMLLQIAARYILKMLSLVFAFLLRKT